MKSIEEIIDSSLNYWVNSQLNSIPGEVPDEMATGKTSDDSNFWKPINSKITDQQIKSFEKDMELILPTELVQILKHKHFLELHVGEVEIYSSPSKGWQLSLSQGFYDTWPREFIIDKGYLPFANYSDWGVWCFSLNEKDENGKHSVYLWDHEDADNFQYVAPTLKIALNKELEENA